MIESISVADLIKSKRNPNPDIKNLNISYCKNIPYSIDMYICDSYTGFLIPRHIGGASIYSDHGNLLGNMHFVPPTPWTKVFRGSIP